MSKLFGKDKYLESQVKFWKEQKDKIHTEEHILTNKKKQSHIQKLPFITISRQYGCFGYHLAEKITEILNQEYKAKPLWAPYNRDMLDKIMTDMGLSTTLTETMTGTLRTSMTNFIQTSFSKFPSQVAIYRKLVETIGLLAANGHVIIIDSAGNVITENIEGGYHIRIVASLSQRAESIAKIQNIGKIEAEKLINEKTKEREEFIHEYVKHDINNPLHYHLIINSSKHTTEEAAKLIIQGMKIKKLL